MQQALDLFTDNLNRARGLWGIAQAVGSITTPALNADDIFRAALVFGVSALDQFVHDIVRLGMLEIHAGTRPVTEGFRSFQIRMSDHSAAVAGGTGAQWFDDAIRRVHGWKSFQQPEKIADVVKILRGSGGFWAAVAGVMGMTAADVRTQLKVVVDRRNKIVHEADLDPTNPGGTWPVVPADINQAIDFIDRVGAAIHASV